MTPVDRTSDRAVYRQIADELRTAIRDGEYGPDDQLPSENTLTEKFGVNRRTVQRALQLLAAERLIRSEFGVGHFVRRRPPVRRLAGDRFRRSHREAGLSAFTVEMRGAGKEYDAARDVEILEITSGPAPTDIAERLGIDVDVTDVVTRSRRYHVDGQPVQVAISYIPDDIARGTSIAEGDTGPGGVYARIEESGHVLSRFTEDVAVEGAEEQVARWLDLPPGATVIHLVRTAFSGDRAVEVCDTWMNPDAFTLSYELPAT